MSKDQKKTIEVPVETVDNLLQTFEYITTSINFWGFKDEFPMNLVLKVCADWLYDLTVLRFPINSVKKTVKKLKNEST